MVTVKYGDQVLQLEAAEAAWITFEEVIEKAFARAGWNGGMPPEGWNFWVTDEANTLYIDTPKAALVEDGNIITVEV